MMPEISHAWSMESKPKHIQQVKKGTVHDLRGIMENSQRKGSKLWSLEVKEEEEQQMKK